MPKENKSGKKLSLPQIAGDPKAPFTNLPELEGSRAQIDWANDIRKNFFAALESEVLPRWDEERKMWMGGVSRSEMLMMNREEQKRFIKFLPRGGERPEHQREFEIDNYKRSYQNYKSFVGFLEKEGIKNQTSAKWWIENREALNKGGGVRSVFMAAAHKADHSIYERAEIIKAEVPGIGTGYFTRKAETITMNAIKTEKGSFVNVGSYANNSPGLQVNYKEWTKWAYEDRKKRGKI